MGRGGKTNPIPLDVQSSKSKLSKEIIRHELIFIPKHKIHLKYAYLKVENIVKI